MKRLFYNNVVLYSIYYKCIHAKRRNATPLPQKGDGVYIDGFPRSANSYIVNAVKSVFKDEINIGAHHLHTVAALKIALNRRVRSYILLRNPLDAIASFYIMQNYYYNTGKTISEQKSYVRGLTQRYVDYYNFVFLMKENVSIINFEDVTRKPEAVLQALRNDYDLNVANADIHSRLESFEVEFKSKQKKKPIERTSTPNEERERKKLEVQKLIRETKEYKQAEEVYRKLKTA